MYTLKELAPDCYQRVVEWNGVARAEPPTVEQQAAFTQSELNELNKAIDEFDIVEIMDGIGDVFVTGAYLHYLDPTHPLVDVCNKKLVASVTTFGHYTTLDVIMRVLDSNDSKFVRVSKVYEDDRKLSTLIESECERIQYEKGGAVRAEIKNGRIVFLNENNKIQKPFCFFNPNFSDIVDKLGLSPELDKFK